MEFTEEQKQQIETKILEAIMQGLDHETISEQDLQPISAFVLDKIDAITTHDELLQFLRELSGKWTVFSQLLVLESGEVKRQVEKEVVEGALKLAKQGQIDDAIKLAQTATEQQ